MGHLKILSFFIVISYFERLVKFNIMIILKFIQFTRTQTFISLFYINFCSLIKNDISIIIIN